jgi:hypothetical protein
MLETHTSCLEFSSLKCNTQPISHSFAYNLAPSLTGSRLCRILAEGGDESLLGELGQVIWRQGIEVNIVAPLLKRNLS